MTEPLSVDRSEIAALDYLCHHSGDNLPKLYAIFQTDMFDREARRAFEWKVSLIARENMLDNHLHSGAAIRWLRKGMIKAWSEDSTELLPRLLSVDPDFWARLHLEMAMDEFEWFMAALGPYPHANLLLALDVYF